MLTKQQYVEYLICTIGNYTSSNLAEHLAEVSHDVITDYLSSERHTARGAWELVEGLVQDSSLYGWMIACKTSAIGDSIERVKLQYSGAEPGLVRGIVNLVHSAGKPPDLCAGPKWQNQERTLR